MGQFTLVVLNIHKTFFRNLIAGWTVITILTGMFMALFELKRVDKYVVEIAFEESKTLSRHYVQFYDNRTDTQLGVVEASVFYAAK